MVALKHTMRGAGPWPRSDETGRVNFAPSLWDSSRHAALVELMSGIEPIGASLQVEGGRIEVQELLVQEAAEIDAAYVGSEAGWIHARVAARFVEEVRPGHTRCYPMLGNLDPREPMPVVRWVVQLQQNPCYDHTVFDNAGSPRRALGCTVAEHVWRPHRRKGGLGERVWWTPPPLDRLQKMPGVDSEWRERTIIQMGKVIWARSAGSADSRWFPTQDEAAAWMAARLFAPSRGNRARCLLCFYQLGGKRSRYGLCARCACRGPQERVEAEELRLRASVFHPAFGGWPGMKLFLRRRPDLERALRSLMVNGGEYRDTSLRAVWSLLAVEVEAEIERLTGEPWVPPPILVGGLLAPVV